MWGNRGGKGTCEEKQKKNEEEIAKLGYSKQNEFLVSKGHTNARFNLKALVEFTGDQDKALEKLIKKLEKGEKGDGGEKWRKHRGGNSEEKKKRNQEEIVKLGYSKQHEFLVSKGFTDAKFNLKALIKFNGDQEKALEKVAKKQERGKKSKEERLKKKEEKIVKLGFSKQHEYLVSKGFTDVKLNLKFLRRSGGDQEKAMKQIQEKSEVKEIKRKRKDEMSPGERDKRKIDRETKKKLKEDLSSFLLNEIKPNTKIIYLDGNNMLFVDNCIRKMCLNNKRALAEKCISDLAVEFAKILGVEQCVLVFDHTKNVSNVNVGSLKFTVCSASPNFKTSDDALVDWMGGLSALENVLVVTSDVGLQIRLKEKGVKMLMKSGAWFKVVKPKLGDEKYAKIVEIEKDFEMVDTKMVDLSIKK
jgi:hypothetical protein